MISTKFVVVAGAVFFFSQFGISDTGESVVAESHPVLTEDLLNTAEITFPKFPVSYPSKPSKENTALVLKFLNTYVQKDTAGKIIPNRQVRAISFNSIPKNANHHEILEFVVRSFPQIEKFESIDCWLTDPDLSLFSELTGLKTIDIHCSSQWIQGTTLKDLPTTLESLSLRFTSMNDDALGGLAHLTSLRNLNLSINDSITGSTLDKLPLSIKALGLGKTNLDENNLKHLKRLINLENLVIDFNEKITGEYFDDLPLTLRVLDLEETEVTDKNLQKLARLTNLKELDVSDSNKLSGGFLNVLPAGMTKLRLSGTTTTENLRYLKRFTQLELLDLFENRYVTAEVLDDLPVSIKDLDLNSTDLTDEEVAHLNRLSYLEALDLSNNRFLTGATFDQLPSSLRTLELSNTWALKDENLVRLSHLRTLEELDIRNCHVSLETIETLKKGMPLLKLVRW